jgi:CHAD domain-containing protein
MIIISSLITSDTFTKHFTKATEKTEENVRQFLIDSNEDNIHDLRVAIRRLDSSFRLFPKKIRKYPKIADHRSEYKKLFSINSEIRDIDIISSKLEKYPKTKILLDTVKEVQQELKEDKLEKLRDAREIALSAYNLKSLKLDEEDIPERKLQQRFQKVVNRFANSIDQHLPIVIADMEKVKELHELRKDCKKLRYTLEVPEKAVKNQQISNLIEYLEGLQDILGSIHDSDIMLQYLRQNYSDNTSLEKVDSLRSMIQAEGKEREALFHTFVIKHGDTISDTKVTRHDPNVREETGRRIIRQITTTTTTLQ